MGHGDADPVVLYDWGKQSVEEAKSLGVAKLDFKTYPGMQVRHPTLPRRGAARSSQKSRPSLRRCGLRLVTCAASGVAARLLPRRAAGPRGVSRENYSQVRAGGQSVAVRRPQRVSPGDAVQL